MYRKIFIAENKQYLCASASINPQIEKTVIIFNELL